MKNLISLLILTSLILSTSFSIPSPFLPSGPSLQSVQDADQEGISSTTRHVISNQLISPITLIKEDLKKKKVDKKDDDDDDDDKKSDAKSDDKSDGDKDDDDKDDKSKDGDDENDNKSKDEGGDDSENDSKSDKSEPDDKSDDTSEENSNSASYSNPDTEEEGDSSSASNTSEEKDDSSAADEESDDEKDDVSNTTENDSNESETTSEETSEESDSDSDSKQVDNKLLIIMVDGVRPDYLTRDERKLKFFNRIKEKGSFVKYVKPVFPSNRFPNWYSIATGKYPERHNIVNDYMYDVRKRELFLKWKSSQKVTSKNSSSDDKKGGGTLLKYWWQSAEPIWITAKKQKKRVHVSWITGCDIEIKKHLPTYCDPYDDNIQNMDTDKYNELVNERLKDILRAFEKDDYDLGMLYYDAVGDAGRKYGPDSKRTKKSFRVFDKIIDDLYDYMEEKKLDDSVNLIVLSDTGMASTKDQRVINLEKFIDFNDVTKLVGEGAFIMIQPEKRKTESVYNQLRQSNVRGLNVYKKEKLPARFHIKKSENVLPIILTADEGYVIETPDISNKVYPRGDSAEDADGRTGYDPDHVEEMRAILLAIGPDIKEDYEGPHIKAVDHYNLFCKLLDIKCKDNDGDDKRIEGLLKESDSSSDEGSSSNSSSDEDDDDKNGAINLMTINNLLIAISLIVAVANFGF